jgi:hypothetical protein
LPRLKYRVELRYLLYFATVNTVIPFLTRKFEDSPAAMRWSLNEVFVANKDTPITIPVVEVLRALVVCDPFPQIAFDVRCTRGHPSIQNIKRAVILW